MGREELAPGWGRGAGEGLVGRKRIRDVVRERGAVGWPPANRLAVPPAAQPEPQRCAGQPGEAAWEQHLPDQGPAQVCDAPSPLPRAAGGSGR